MMNNKTVNRKLMAIVLGAVLLGIFLGASALSLWQSPADGEVNKAGTTERQPLYWVAPMDASYRRDQPGKSPMGMDLVPVYEQAETSDDLGAGVVKIPPHVVNNLGVRTAMVDFKSMASDITTLGYVKYDQHSRVAIHPRVAGWIEKLYLKASGEPVTKGQLLYRLYSPQLVNAQQELVIALKSNNHALITAAKERLLALQLSSQFIDQLAKTGKVQQTVSFYAPQTGVAEALRVSEGSYVSPKNTLFAIANLDQVWVEAEVFARDAALLKTGLTATMSLDYFPGKQWQGVVDYIYPSLNPDTRTLRVRLTFANPEQQLKANMFAQVVIQADKSDPVMVVPKEAVIRTGQQNRVVLALADGQFKSIAVDIGRVGQDYIEILAGLTKQDKVVTSAQFLLDSESSKTSDFNRFSPKQVADVVWLEGKVNKVMAEHSMVNISHSAVELWQWPEMTMDFTLADGVDIKALAAGQTLHFEVTKTSADQYQVTSIHIVSQPEVSSARVTGTINSIDGARRILNISRGPIEKWQRPAATMDFVLAEHIDLAQFDTGDQVIFTFEIRDDFIITDMASVAPAAPSGSAQPKGEANHQHDQRPDQSDKPVVKPVSAESVDSDMTEHSSHQYQQSQHQHSQHNGQSHENHDSQQDQQSAHEQQSEHSHESHQHH